LSDLPIWFSAGQLAGFALPNFPNTTRGVLDWMAREVGDRPEKMGLQWRERAGRGGGVEYNLKVLPVDVRHALLTVLRAERDATAPAIDARARMEHDFAWAQYLRKSGAQKKVAEARARAIAAVDDRLAHGMTKGMAVAQVCDSFGVSPAAYYLWEERVRGIPPADHAAHLLDRRRGGDGLAAECSPDAWEFYKADYLRPEKPSAESCYRRLERAAAANSWVVPCHRTLRRRIEAMPAEVRVLRRQGEKALKAMFPHQTRDRGVFHALQAVCADGHKLDVFVDWGNGRIGRCELMGFQDLYSGLILSWRIDESENRNLIRLAFGDLAEEFGIPEQAYLDNGRAFASKWISGGARSRFRFKRKQDEPQGVLETLGVQVHFVTPYSGQSKPIERSWRDFGDDIARDPRLAGAYTGANPTAKPENYASRAIPVDELMRVIGDCVVQHNNRLKRDTRVCGGRLSFRQAFDASYAKAMIRKCSAEQRQYFLLMAESLTVRAPDASLYLMGNRYWSADLVSLIGKKVTVRFDPDRLQEDLQVYTTDDRLICRAACVAAVGFNDLKAAQDHSRNRRAWMRAVREVSERERGMSIDQVAAQMDAMTTERLPPPAPSVIRLVQGNTARLIEAAPEIDETDDGLSDTERLWLAGHRRLRLVEGPPEV
jgi:putative transposase